MTPDTTTGLPPGDVICGGTSVILQGSITLQAIGGQGSWTTTVSGDISVSPAGGTLAAGQQETIAVNCAAPWPTSAGVITFEPGPVYIGVYTN